MKIFITFSIFAMISAGVYGIVDMSHDVFEGTMINYRQAEQEMFNREEPVAELTKTDVKDGNYIHAATATNSSDEKLITKIKYISTIYSRGEPVTRKVKVVEKPSAKEDSTARAQQNHVLGEQLVAMQPVENKDVK